MASDLIIVRGLECVGRHGVYDEERRDGRRFSVDLEAQVSTVVAGRSDLLHHTVDYRDLARFALEVLEGPSVHLIEVLAERIVERIFEGVPGVARLRVRLRKFAEGVPGDPKWVGIEIERANPAYAPS